MREGAKPKSGRKYQSPTAGRVKPRTLPPSIERPSRNAARMAWDRYILVPIHSPQYFPANPSRPCPSHPEGPPKPLAVDLYEAKRQKKTVESGTVFNATPPLAESSSFWHRVKRGLTEAWTARRKAYNDAPVEPSAVDLVIKAYQDYKERRAARRREKLKLMISHPSLGQCQTEEPHQLSSVEISKDFVLRAMHDSESDEEWYGNEMEGAQGAHNAMRDMQFADFIISPILPPHSDMTASAAGPPRPCSSIYTEPSFACADSAASCGVEYRFCTDRPLDDDASDRVSEAASHSHSQPLLDASTRDSNGQSFLSISMLRDDTTIADLEQGLEEYRH